MVCGNTHSGGDVKKFNAIEGLRGWLAWAVVISHVALTSGVYAKGMGPALVEAGSTAVLVFIVVSGFVITQLVVTRPEPYGIYILRRFMRIFPLFAVTCFIGYFTAVWLADTLSHVPWTNDPHFIVTARNTITGVVRSEHDFFWSNIFAHLLMIHGAISDNVIPFSEHTYNTPAWSLSLEWQFYLLAPLIIPVGRRIRNVVWLAMLVAALEIGYSLGIFGAHTSPSFIPGVAQYFFLGIASRLIYPTISGAVRHPNIIIAIIVVLAPLGRVTAPTLIWAFMLTGLALDRSTPNGASFARLYEWLLESRVALYFGSRSYSVYLCHWPALSVCLVGWFKVFPDAGDYATFFGVSTLLVPLTLAASELLYRSIERPGIALGSKLARSIRTPVVAPVTVPQ
jgi:peptidoglycan/LPS O-acetylase OafA/YrhL